MDKIKNLSAICSNCGGQMNINTMEEKVECPYCGTNFIVSQLLEESDEVKIEKIKLNSQREIEQEKLKHEAEQNRNQEEKESIEKFKKSKFSKVLLVFFAVSVLYFFICNGFLTKVLTLVQAGSFIGAWLMGSKIIKEPMKGLHTIIAILAFVLIIPIITIDDGSSNTKAEKIVWNDIEMHEIIPQPKSDKGKIIFNSQDRLSIDVNNLSKEDYSEYIEECKVKGFTVESEKENNSYDAFNNEGYKLRLYYYESKKELDINLEAPIQMKENAWVSTPLSKLIPEPQSKFGKVDSNSEKYFVYLVGNTSKDDFSIYSNSVLNAGFSKDYKSEDEYFYGQNAEGYIVELKYQGNNVVRISISAPEENSEKEKSNNTENKKEEKETKEEEKTPEKENKKKDEENKTSNKANSNGLRKEFKEAMDSYEDFVDEYVSFMKKYSKSNGTDLSLINDYSKYMTKLSEMEEKFNKWEDENLNTAEEEYYIKVQTRVNKKLLEVAK